VALDRDCGESLPGSLGNYDPASSLWKTSQRCAFGDWAEFSGTWPRSGMMLGGTAFQLAPLAPLTGAIGSGSSLGDLPLFPTPTTGKGGGGGPGMWPTPTVPNGGRTLHHVDTCNGRTAYHQGKKVQVDLAQAVKLWPTPTATLGDKGGRVTLRKSREGGTLIEAVSARLMPTPSATDWKGSSAPGQRRGQLTDPEKAVIQAGGPLNPTWVEWLMGLPIGWSDCEGSGTG
jgi:hypothetical protein